MKSGHVPRRRSKRHSYPKFAKGYLQPTSLDFDDEDLDEETEASGQWLSEQEEDDEA